MGPAKADSFPRVVPTPVKHTHVSREGSALEKKEFKFGNTTATVYSSLANKEPEEIKQWFQDEWRKGNPVCDQIVEAIAQCASSKQLE